jgi:hypothetical protein
MKKLFFLFFFALQCVIINAQSWQWIKGGGADFPCGTNASNDELLYDLKTTENGDIYFASRVAAGTYARFDTAFMAVDGISDVVFGKMNCSGNLLWYKMIGGCGTIAPGGDNCNGIAIDKRGNTYLAGKADYSSTPCRSARFGNDTSVSALAGINYYMYLISYDSIGHLRWLKVDSSLFGYVKHFSIQMTGDGKLFTFTKANGAEFSGYNFNGGYYLMQWDPSTGALLSAIQIVGNVTFDNLTVQIDDYGNLYLAGTSSIDGSVIGTDTLHIPASTNQTFIARFDTAGNYYWLRQSGGRSSGFYDLATDKNGNAYCAGVSGVLCYFNQDTIYDAYTISSPPVLVKYDSSGNVKWVRVVGHVNAYCEARNVYVNDKNEIYWSGYTSGTDYFGRDTITLPGAYDVFLCKMDTAGNFVNNQFIYNYTLDSYTGAITSDNSGNVYVGGYSDGAMYAGTDSTYYYGGYSDFFIAKYGTAGCACVKPISGVQNIDTIGADILLSSNSLYADSLYWFFGDGQGSPLLSPSHHFTAKGYYTVRLVAYNSCGSDTITEHIFISFDEVGISNLGQEDVTVKAFPNPASESVSVLVSDNSSNAEFILLDMTGRVVLQKSLSAGTNNVGLNGISAGVYVWQYHRNNMLLKSGKMVKN